MKRLAWGFFAFFLLAAVLIAVFASRLSSTYVVERSILTSAPAEKVFSLLIDLRRFPEWSPWQRLDPQMNTSLSGPEMGLGSSYSWEGNSDVGAGRMTIVGVVEQQEVAVKLEFLRPFPDTSTTYWRVSDEGAQRRITWSMEGKRNSLLPKVFHLLMNLDQLIGKDFESGLNSLRALAEKS